MLFYGLDWVWALLSKLATRATDEVEIQLLKMNPIPLVKKHYGNGIALRARDILANAVNLLWTVYYINAWAHVHAVYTIIMQTLPTCCG